MVFEDYSITKRRVYEGVNKVLSGPLGAEDTVGKLLGGLKAAT